MTALMTPPEARGDSVKATVAERTRRQQTRRQDVPRHGHPAGMAHPATRLRLVADHGRLLPQERAVPRRPPQERAVPRRPPRERAVPRREPARRVIARPGRIPDNNPVPERTPIRLTRRGRVVVAAAVVLLVAAVSLALVLWVPTG
jgi:hypothetical protein